VKARACDIGTKKAKVANETDIEEVGDVREVVVVVKGEDTHFDACVEESQPMEEKNAIDWCYFFLLSLFLSLLSTSF